MPHVSIPYSRGKKKKSPEKRQEPKRKKVAEEELPVQLRGFRYEHRHRLVCEEQMDPKNKVDPGPYKVAKYIVTGRGETETKWDLEELNSTQLRKLAIQFGCKGAGGKTKFNCRQQMALCKEGGELHGNVNIPNPASTCQEKKLNTLLRILNAAFSSTMVDCLIHLNDTKGRKDFEGAAGRNPVKAFFADLSEMVNDPLNGEDLKDIADSDEDENEVLHSLVANNLINLTDFTQQTHKTAQQNLCDMMKARERCRKAACTTGNHENDLWSYCGNKTFTQIRNGTVVPACAVCCCEVLCLKHPDIDGSFAESLSDALKSDSAATPTGSASSTLSGSSSKRSVAQTIQECFTGLQQTSASAQREASFEVEKNKAHAEVERGDWKEHHEASVQFLKHKKEEDENEMLMVLIGRRINMLEEKLKIPLAQSVTKGTVIERTEVPSSDN